MSALTEGHLEVVRSARYALLGEPGPEVRELWIVLHGYRQLAARFLRRFRSLARPWRLLAAPEALSRFYLEDGPGRHGPGSPVGATWMTREDREAEIHDYVRYLDRFHDHVQGRLAAPVPVLTLGFSQGCHTLARWVARGGVRPRWVVLWGEVLPADLEASPVGPGLRDARLVSVQGQEDALIPPAILSRQRHLAGRLGLELDERNHPSGHTLDAWVLAGLAREFSGRD
ncbi:MAG: hypothetical protein RQ751_00050 [Longimicrobiales bacterium]|nr:hypothetical protein [Longimicrobiales bacterium]